MTKIKTLCGKQHRETACPKSRRGLPLISRFSNEHIPWARRRVSKILRHLEIGMLMQAARAGQESEQAAQDVSALSVFFDPKSVTVVGASSDPKKPGNTALRHMISMGYKGKLFPVNPREK